ncbi:MAG: efflux RND transporter periplasmic adaptor subunit [Deltaproteobacteria bacterium]|nr:MAG: efflux RND transporter periplasmic adaptor subunit [Deltaproteobacteria bacterium]
MSTQPRLSLLLLAVATAAAPACDKKAEGVHLPDAPEPVVITTDVAGAQPTEHGAGLNVHKGDVLKGASLPMTASTAAHRQSTLSARISGTVLEVKVREGDRVRKDDVLVVFDPRDIALQVKSAGAAIAAARVGVETAKVEAERAEKLLANKAIPAQQFDLANAQYRGAKAQLQQALVAKEMAESHLIDAEIKAPYDSVIIKRHANEGEYLMVMPPSPLVTLQEVGVIDVNVAVPASRLEEVKVGTTVRITVPARNITRDAEVTRIVPMMNPMTRTAMAVVELEDPDGSLIPGLFAEVRVLSPASDEPAPAEEKPAPAPEKAAPAEVTP